MQLESDRMKFGIATVSFPQVSSCAHLSAIPKGMMNRWVSSSPTTWVGIRTRLHGYEPGTLNHHSTETQYLEWRFSRHAGSGGTNQGDYSALGKVLAECRVCRLFYSVFSMDGGHGRLDQQKRLEHTSAADDGLALTPLVL